MTSVLGINLSHDTSVCLIKDGKIYAAEEERWSKLKHNSSYTEDYIFPHNALKYVLEESNTSLKDIQHTVCVSMSAKDMLGDYLFPRKELKNLPCVSYISHHKAHILSGFFLSPFQEAVGLCIDGGGSLLGLDFNTRERTSGYYCNNDFCTRIYSNFDKIFIKNKKLQPQKNSLGLFYLNFAKKCIPYGDEPEGSMMAMAAYGTSDKYYSTIKDLITLLPNGQYQIQEPYGSNNNDVYHLNGIDWYEGVENVSFEERANLAKAVQQVFEETVIHILNELHALTNIPNLIFSGGCALNSKLNGIITQKTKFNNVYIPPAPHDGGTAIGAALFAWHYFLGNNRIQMPQTISWGPQIEIISDNDIKKIEKLGAKCYSCETTELVENVTDLLFDNNVILWARGRMEFGPRALGNRSIIASAINSELKKRVNEIKKRAWYRPLAPSVLDDKFNEYFEGDSDHYMNKTCKVKFPQKFEAITHKDGTARVQLVSENCEFYPLLKQFEKKGKDPIILNTSLNLKGVPIARNKDDVLDIFTQLNVDNAVIGNTIISKPVKWVHNNIEYKIQCFSPERIRQVLNIIRSLYNSNSDSKMNDKLIKIFEIVKLIQVTLQCNTSDFELISVIFYIIVSDKEFMPFQISEFENIIKKLFPNQPCKHLNLNANLSEDLKIVVQLATLMYEAQKGLKIETNQYFVLLNNIQDNNTKEHLKYVLSEKYNNKT